MDKVIAHAPAKINLALQVEQFKLGEAKHRLNSIFCTTALADTLVFEFISGSEPFSAEVTITGIDLDFSFIKPNNNTLTKTVDSFEGEYGRGFLPTGTLKVELIKSIPTQAGLGGGSSDAAAMLRMLCWLAQVEPTSEKSLAAARAVGADVPFFLFAPKGGLCAQMQGFGDELVKALPKPDLSLALIKPNGGVSTKSAYARFDEMLLKQDAALSNEMHCVEAMSSALEQGASSERIAKLCCNNLEPAAFELLPSSADIKQELLSQPGVQGALLSGSGSTVFAVCESSSATQHCVQHFAERGLWAVATQS